MASQYAHTVNEKRYNLIDQLVVKLLQVEVSKVKKLCQLGLLRSCFVCLCATKHGCSTGSADLTVAAAVASQRGHENFELARDFCVQKAWFNSFHDINPRETEEFYARYVMPCTAQFIDVAHASRTTTLPTQEPSNAQPAFAPKRKTSVYGLQVTRLCALLLPPLPLLHPVQSGCKAGGR